MYYKVKKKKKLKQKLKYGHKVVLMVTLLHYREKEKMHISPPHHNP